MKKMRVHISSVYGVIKFQGKYSTASNKESYKQKYY